MIYNKFIATSIAITVHEKINFRCLEMLNSDTYNRADWESIKFAYDRNRYNREVKSSKYLDRYFKRLKRKGYNL